MSTKFFIHDGVAEAVYDDRLMPLLKALGDLKVSRASEVEFDHLNQVWVAKVIDFDMDYRSCNVLAQGPDRNEVIQEEVKILEKEMEVRCRTQLK